MLLVTAAEMRRLDQLTIASGTPGKVLMERAGRGAAAALLAQVPAIRRRGRRVLVVAGKGNNGGDGFVMARLLRRRHLRAEVTLLGTVAAVGGDAAHALQAYRRARGPLVEISDRPGLETLRERIAAADVVVDAIFGTGLDKPVAGLHAAAIELINAGAAPVFAVDMPSGLNADTGRPMGTAVRAAATATFGFAKIGQVLEPGVQHCGVLSVIEIGLDADAIAAHPPRATLLDDCAVGRLVPVRAGDAHKGDCGHVLVVAGSFGKTGAAQLASRAAARAGAGLVTLVGPRSLHAVYAAGALETMTDVLPDDDGHIRFDPASLERLLAGKTAVVIGPGIGTHDGAVQTVTWLLANARVPMVVDADAITIVARTSGALRGASAHAVLTPHPGEMARLVGADSRAVQADRAGMARQFATAHGCTLVLKGARTVVADRTGFLSVNPSGNPGMASGGMGDVLSGVIGGLLAQGLAPPEAARLGVYVHGYAADRVAADGQVGLIASDLLPALRPALQALRATADA